MRLLICDDHQLLVEGLSLALPSYGHTVVGKATTPEEAIEAARAHQPDACLLDVGFPNGNGVSAIGAIHEVSPNTKVVILSGSLSPALVADAIAQGAVGYVTKEKPIEVIAGTLKMVHDGYLGVDPLVLQEALRPRNHNVGPLWMLRFLTPREWQVLRCIVDGLSTDEIASQCGVERSTARTHVQNLLSKLGVHSRLAAAALMRNHATEETWPVHLRAERA